MKNKKKKKLTMDSRKVLNEPRPEIQEIMSSFMDFNLRYDYNN